MQKNNKKQKKLCKVENYDLLKEKARKILKVLSLNRSGVLDESNFLPIHEDDNGDFGFIYRIKDETKV